VIRRLFIRFLILLGFFACSKVDPAIPDVPGEETDTTVVEKDDDKHGVAYMFDESAIPEFHLEIEESEWNRLLSLYDANKDTKQCIHASLRFVKGEEEIVLDDIGLRLRGNTSRRRPEDGTSGHVKDNKTGMNRVHMSLKFDEYVEQSIHGCKSVRFKFFPVDPTFVREWFCYDTFRKFGVWTSLNETYCRVWVKVSTDSSETYYGVCQLLENVNKGYIKQRKNQFKSSDGNLWKCRYWSKLDGEWAPTGVDTGTDESFVYEYKFEEQYYQAAKTQLRNFMTLFNSLSGDDFRSWVEKVIDVPFLLRTYAVNVALSNWDDYWNNANNYYLYFNSKDQLNYRLFFIPYDLDISMGTTGTAGVQTDAVTQNPLKWGNNTNPLICKLLQFDDWRQLYCGYLVELFREDGLMNEKVAVRVIRSMQNRIKPFLSNDTGEEMAFSDLPAGWSTHQEYRLMSYGDNCYFTVKKKTIDKYCK